MNKFRYIIYSVLSALIISCTYDFPEESQPAAGGADFTKYVAVGNSLTSGFMNGALYTAGQQNSYPLLMAKQMESAGGGTFNQPDINSTNGYYINSPSGIALGRLTLKYGCPDGTSPAPSPLMPGEAIGKYNGNAAALNNFGVPIIKLVYAINGQASSQNPFYTRWFPSTTEAVSTSPVALAAGSGHTFFSMWLGNNDALLYATAGGTMSASPDNLNPSPTPPQYLGVGPEGPISNPLYPSGASYYKTFKPANRNGVGQNDMTPVEAFQNAYTSTIAALLGTSAKGIVATIPDVTNIPYFTTIPPSAFKIPLNLGQTIPAQAGPPLGGKTYAQVLNELYFQYGFTSQQNFNLFTPDDQNYLAIETFDDAGQRVIRQINPQIDLVTLPVPTDSLGLGGIVKCGISTGKNKAGWGIVSNLPLTSQGTIDLPKVNPATIKPYPIPSTYILDAEEKTAVSARIVAFNEIIKKAESERVAYVDFYSVFQDVAKGEVVLNGINFTATFAPPFGAFSVDGIHPNARGYAFISNKFIEAINKKFNSSIPQVNPNDYPGNDLPQ